MRAADRVTVGVLIDALTLMARCNASDRAVHDVDRIILEGEHITCDLAQEMIVNTGWEDRAGSYRLASPARPASLSDASAARATSRR